MSQPTSAPTIRKFNPGVFQSDQEVVEQFVVRHKALDAALAVVKRNLVSESCQHALIVAPRGMGKTMLLARMEAELRLDGDLASNLIPVRFMEESYQVADLTGFWLEVLFQLGRECSRLGLDAGAELEAAHASFCARWRDTHVRLDVLAAIERGLASIGRRMVLMVENLQALSETWPRDDEWGLRRVLQTESMIMLMGTATTRFKSLEDADRAFFDLFRLIELGPLTTKECAALWNMATRQNLAAREIRPFEILTGGSPRLLVLLAGVGHRLTLKQLLADMVGLVDEHTEYFRQCLDSLPAGERRVFLALADLWEPSLASAIADRARMDIRTTSVMLQRLTDRGAVSASAARRSRRYSVTERMFCFYYSLRRERNQPAVIRRFIEFMVAFYDPSAATTVFADLDDGSDVGRVMREQLLQAIVDQDAAYRWVEQWDEEFKAVSLHHLWEEVLSKMQCMVDQCSDGEFADESQFVDLVHRLRRMPATEARSLECIQLSSFATENESKIPPPVIVALCQTCLELVDTELVVHDRGYRSWAARTKVMKARAHVSSKDYESALICCNEVIEACTGLPEPDRTYLYSGAILVKQRVLIDTADYEETISESLSYLEAYGQSEDEELGFFQAQALLFLVQAEWQLGRQACAGRVVRDLDSRFGNSQDRYLQLTVAQAMLWILRHASDCEDKISVTVAEEVADLALARFGGSQSEDLCKVAAIVVAWKYGRHVNERDFGSAELCLRLGMERWVSTATDFGLEWVATRSVPRAGCLVQLGDFEAAEALVHEWLPCIAEIEGDSGKFLWWCAECVLFQCYVFRGSMEAIDVLGSMVEDFEPDVEYCVQGMTKIVMDAGAVGKFADRIPSVLEASPKVRASLLPVIVALRLLNREQVSAPPEVLEVASDVLDTINARRAEGNPFGLDSG